MLTIATGVVYNVPSFRMSMRASTDVSRAIVDPFFVGFTVDVSRYSANDRSDWGCWL